MKYKFIVLFIFMQVTNYSVWSQTNPDDIVGVWLIGGKEPAKVQIYKSGQKYYGKIAWLKFSMENNKPKVDANNPDKNKRNQQIMGLIILKEFTFDGDDEWEDGKVYDPQSGKTYSCYISLKNKNTLKLRGYVGISLLGRTEIWTRTTL